jgi:GAF domain-containing protein
MRKTSVMPQDPSEPRAYDRPVPDVRDQLAETLADITARLLEQVDEEALLRLILRACTEMLDVPAAGVLLADPRGGIAVAAVSDERTRFLEVLQAQTEQGPCVESIRTNRMVGSADLTAETDRWPGLATAALRADFRAVFSVPMRLDGQSIGGLNLLYTRTGRPPAWQLTIAQVLADLGTLGLVQEHGMRRGDRLAERALTAFNDRVHLSQAVGLVAGTLGLSVDEARAAVHRHAQRRSTSARDVAHALTSGTLPPEELLP